MTDDRRRAIRDQTRVNGIDFLEVDPATPTRLVVHFVHNLPDAPVDPVPPDPADALGVADFAVTGGERITNLAVAAATRTADDQMTIDVDQEGDFSAYTLQLRGSAGLTPTGFDPHSASVDFIFHVECATRFDCKATLPVAQPAATPPRIDYLAKDYPGFVRVMLDRMALVSPRWQERDPADLGVAVVEALAYVADHLSYRQDVIATEAYLGTARLRTSVRRHARLVDYRIGEGNNARAWLRIGVNADTSSGIPSGTPCVTAYVGQTQTPPVLKHTPSAYQEAINAGALFWQTLHESGPLFVAHTEMPLYNWSDISSFLPPGSTHATLRGSFPNLKRGMLVVLAEIKGRSTGRTEDADPEKRQVVRLIRDATLGTDPVINQAITEIEWHPEDALRFPLCIASPTDPEHPQVPTLVSAAWGNIVLVDQGRWVETEHIGVVASDPNRRFRPRLSQSPLTFAAPDPFATDHPTVATMAIHSATAATTATSSDAVPAVTLESTDADGNKQPWQSIGDMLAVNVDPLTAVFVVEVENDGAAYVRFGDGINGMRPVADASFEATYRIGNGSLGNVARDTIVFLDTHNLDPVITSVTNPLPAWGGVDPEPVEHIRQSAPVAFRTQERAVTMDDWRDVALKFAGVRRAAATLRWTGSWYTVFLTVEREAGKVLDSTFATNLKAFADAYRLAGFDLEVEDAMRVPLFVEMHVCVKDEYVATDVERALRAIFNNRVSADGSLGMFHPDRLDLGQPIYVSPLYARAQAVDGVASVQIVRFEREAKPGPDGLRTGVLTPGPLELFVLENDPDFPERGRFELHVESGL